MDDCTYTLDTHYHVGIRGVATVATPASYIVPFGQKPACDGMEQTCVT